MLISLLYLTTEAAEAADGNPRRAPRQMIGFHVIHMNFSLNIVLQFLVMFKIFLIIFLILLIVLRVFFVVVVGHGIVMM